MKSVKIWFCELCGMIQVPSSGAEDVKKVLPTPVNKIPIKLNPLSLPLLVCFGDFKFHMLLYVTFFFHFLLLWKAIWEEAAGGFSMFLIHKSNRPSLGTDKSRIRSQDCSPRFVSVCPAPRLWTGPLPPWASRSTSLRAGRSPWPHQSQHALTRRLSFVCSCTHSTTFWTAWRGLWWLPWRSHRQSFPDPGGWIPAHSGRNTASYFAPANYFPPFPFLSTPRVIPLDHAVHWVLLGIN